MAIKRTDAKDFGSPIQTDDYYKSTQRQTYKEALDEFAEKHSEMMTPWAYNDYHEMEHWYPDIDPKPWTWDWNPKQPPGSRIDSDYFDPSGANPTRSGEEEMCALPCDGAEVEDCSEVFECDAEDLGVDFYDVRVVDGNRWVADIWTEGKSIGAPKTMIKIRWESGAPTGSEVEINAYTRTLFGKHIMAIGGHICTANILLNCCDATTALSFDDDSTADTIAQNSSITLYILGSGSDFKWSVSGTGFSLSKSTTSGNTNTLIADESACGMATITVTDCADNSVSFSIRGTTGQWVFQSNTCELTGMPDTVTDLGYGDWRFEKISGNEKQIQQAEYEGTINYDGPCPGTGEYYLTCCHRCSDPEDCDYSLEGCKPCISDKTGIDEYGGYIVDCRDIPTEDKPLRFQCYSNGILEYYLWEC